MKTLREKTTFFLTALAYLLFHLRGGATATEMLSGTAAQLLTTAPYCIGFTFIFARLISYLHHGRQPAWDRIARIFFTIGILFGFFFALYEYLEQAGLTGYLRWNSSSSHCCTILALKSHLLIVQIAACTIHC